MTAEEHIKRVGLLGDMHDPAAQLLEEVFAPGSVEFVELVTPAIDRRSVDEIVVLSQSDALAHIATLAASSIPCRVLLRRRTAPQAEHVWRSGLRWLVSCLKRADTPLISLWALTPAAAQDIEATTEMTVRSLPELPRIETPRPPVSVSRGQGAITFTRTGPRGRRETRRADPDVFNWVRIRRLADLRPGDADDLDWSDIIAFATGAGDPASPDSERRPVCALVVVPNGVGLGHITRMMAVANILKRELTARVVFWSFSRAAEILSSAGFDVVLRQTAAHLGAHPPDWRDWETREFSKTVQKLGPDIVCYDGGTFDSFIINGLRMPGCGRTGIVWVRRGMFQPGTDALLIESEQYCDLVLEPGDLASEKDQGPTRTREAQNRGFSARHHAEPLTLKPFLDPYTRREAKRRLKLGLGRHCLISLGGAFGNWDMLRQRLIESAARNRVTLVWAQSPLAAPPDTDDRKTLIRRFYPLTGT